MLMHPTLYTLSQAPDNSIIDTIVPGILVNDLKEVGTSQGNFVFHYLKRSCLFKQDHSAAAAIPSVVYSF